MKFYITGAHGNIGSRLVTEFAAQGHESIGVDVDAFDITAFDTVVDQIAAARPDVVIHCAAMTNVDRCAQQPDEALRVNGFGTQNIAVACQRVGAALCYISTNEVFDGERGTPYRSTMYHARRTPTVTANGSANRPYAIWLPGITLCVPRGFSRTPGRISCKRWSRWPRRVARCPS